jgi:hypothetical protein
MTRISLSLISWLLLAATVSRSDELPGNFRANPTIEAGVSGGL